MPIASGLSCLCKATSFYSDICCAFLTFVVRILTFVERIITFVVIIITSVVITKAKAKAKANAIVKIRTKVKLRATEVFFYLDSYLT